MMYFLPCVNFRSGVTIETESVHWLCDQLGSMESLQVFQKEKNRKKQHWVWVRVISCSIFSLLLLCILATVMVNEDKYIIYTSTREETW